MANPCPACGFLTVPLDYYGTYNLCPVCDWEDDGVQLANPGCGGGANSESLIEAQAAALARYPLGDSRTSIGSARSDEWRPLTAKEIATATAECAEKYWKNKAVLEPEEAYWRQHPDR